MIADAKHLIFEGLRRGRRGRERIDHGRARGRAVRWLRARGGARTQGLKLAMPAERSGQNMFDFQYDEQFGEHVESFDPDFTKVLVRYKNPDGDSDGNREQLEKLKRLSDWSTRTTASSSSSCCCRDGSVAGGRRGSSAMTRSCVPI